MSTRLRFLVLVTGAPLPAVRSRNAQPDGAEPCEDFAAMFEAGLRAPLDGNGAPADIHRYDVLQHGADDPLLDVAGYDGVLMTGSAAYVEDSAPWMQWAQRLLRALVDVDMPYLGVCFGHQMLGQAMGADVGANPRGREMGTIDVVRTDDDDALLGALPQRFAAHVTHRDVVRVPNQDIVVLAAAPHDPCHAIRVGRRAWGVQFHPEFDDDVMGGYLRARREALDAERGVGATDERLARLRPTPHAAAVLARFAVLCAGTAAAAHDEVCRVA